MGRYNCNLCCIFLGGANGEMILLFLICLSLREGSGPVERAALLPGPSRPFIAYFGAFGLWPGLWARLRPLALFTAFGPLAFGPAFGPAAAVFPGFPGFLGAERTNRKHRTKMRVFFIPRKKTGSSREPQNPVKDACNGFQRSFL